MHTQLKQDITQHFSDYVPPLSQKKLLIPGGPWAIAIDKVSDSSFSPRIEEEGLLSKVVSVEGTLCTWPDSASLLHSSHVIWHSIFKCTPLFVLH